jgi:hypothetical protein
MDSDVNGIYAGFNLISTLENRAEQLDVGGGKVLVTSDNCTLLSF